MSVFNCLMFCSDKVMLTPLHFWIHWKPHRIQLFLLSWKFYIRQWSVTKFYSFLISQSAHTQAAFPSAFRIHLSYIFIPKDWVSSSFLSSKREFGHETKTTALHQVPYVYIYTHTYTYSREFGCSPFVNRNYNAASIEKRATGNSSY